MSMVLMAGRCSDDDGADSAKAPASDAAGGEAGLIDGNKAEAGVESDPLGDTFGSGPTGNNDMTAPVEDLAAPGGAVEDPTFEAEPLPEAAPDL